MGAPRRRSPLFPRRAIVLVLLTAGLSNLLITPHCAWGSRGARQRLLDATVANIRAFIAGE